MATTCDERVLFILPYPEPKESLNNLRRNFPSIEMTYIRAGTADDGTWGETAIDPSKPVVTITDVQPSS